MLTLKVCLHLLACITLCSSLVQNFTFQANTLCDEYIELVLDGEPETTAQSAMACSMLCAGQAECGGVLYYDGTNACHVVNADSPMLAACALPGAKFYKYEPACTTSRLVIGLPDAQFTASSALDFPWTQPQIVKLSEGGSWMPSTDNSAEYIQINFMTVKTVISISTWGNNAWERWVTSYKMLASSDCVAFEVLNDEEGNAKIFLGNTGTFEMVTNDVKPNVKARCVRINPVTWCPGGIALKIEIAGLFC